MTPEDKVDRIILRLRELSTDMDNILTLSTDIKMLDYNLQKFMNKH